MGDSKRRKEKLGDQYGKDEPIFSGIPITKKQASQFVEWTSRGSWIGIILLVVAWVTIRFIGPSFGWWHVN